jgi:hypothetical protein
MLSLKTIIAAAFCLVSLAAHSQSANRAPLDCSAGPATRSYGGVPWLVYACSDGDTVVLVSAPDSPAAPFYFTLFRKDGRYVVAGEGAGARSVTDRAYADLTALTDAEVRGLLAVAMVSAPPEARK